VDRETIEQLIKDRGVSKVQVGGFDLDGVLRGKYISRDKFLSSFDDGIGFCDVIFGWDCGDHLYDNSRFTGWHTGFPDLRARFVPESFRLIPWEARTGFAQVEYYSPDGPPLPICPRQVLKRVAARAEGMGYRPRMAAEYEFFLFEETPRSLEERGFHELRPESPGMYCYSILRAAARADFVQILMDQLGDFGIEIEGLHTETGPGAFEACIRYADAVGAADSAGLFKTAVKILSARQGLMASFMAKWNADMPGCGGHIHQSLIGFESGANLFAGSPCSKLAEHYIAGQQEALPELAPLLLPTINSYKRLVPGLWAPTAATWGVENRTNSLRLVPGSSDGATRVETRIPGADASPHLAMAACLAAGLHGIQHQLTPTAPTTGSAYEEAGAPGLPRSLADATTRMRESALARDWFGDEFIDHFCRSREWECREFEKAVTDWEVRRYFEVI